MLARSLPAPAPLYPAHGCLLPLLGVLSGHLPTLVTATNYKHKPIAHGRNLTLLGAKFAICLQILLSQQNEDGCVKLSSLFETEKAWAWRHMPFSLVLALWVMAESTEPACLLSQRLEIYLWVYTPQSTAPTPYATELRCQRFWVEPLRGKAKEHIHPKIQQQPASSTQQTSRASAQNIHPHPADIFLWTQLKQILFARLCR